MGTYYKPQSPIQSGEDFIYPITTADQIMKSDNSRLEQNGEIVADNSPKLGGIAASEYALKNKTVPTSRTVNGKALSENITLSASDVGARPNTWMPSASDVGALEQNGTAANSNKLGGKAPEYYLQPRNLLDNSDFLHPVNQRGKTSVSNNGYFIDRWIIYSADEAKRVTSIDSNGLTTAGGGAVRQIVSKEVTPKDIGEYTFAVCKSDGSIYVNNLYRNSSGDMVCSIQSAGTYIWAALYEGNYTAETLPPYVPKGYAAELEECRRYFRRYTAKNASLILSGLVTSGAKDVSVHAPELTPMRTKNVSIAYSGSGVIIRGVSGYATECSGSSIYGDISVSPYQNNSSFCATIDINKKDGTAWGLTNNTPVVVSFAANSTLDYIADL